MAALLSGEYSVQFGMTLVNMRFTFSLFFLFAQVDTQFNFLPSSPDRAINRVWTQKRNNILNSKATYKHFYHFRH